MHATCQCISESQRANTDNPRGRSAITGEQHSMQAMQAKPLISFQVLSCQSPSGPAHAWLVANGFVYLRDWGETRTFGGSFGFVAYHPLVGSFPQTGIVLWRG